MKKYILILFLFLLAYEAYPQVRLSTMDSVTTFTPIDLFWLNTKPSSAFVNRKVSWRTMRSNIEDFMADSAHTWAQRQTFSNGATFSAASHGAVTFADTVTTTGLWTNWLHRGTSTALIGSVTEPFFSIYAKNFIAPNTEGNDSCIITYDDSTLTINKTISVANLEITNQLDMPDSTTFNGIALSESAISLSGITDSIITITSPASSITIKGIGFSISPGLDSIAATWAGNGQLLTITNEVNFSIIVQDSYPSDGNIDLSASFTMGIGDVLTLKYNSALQVWREVSKSDKTP